MARLPAEPSMEAKRRWKVVRWCEEHGGKVRLTARHFGYSPDTISRWVQAYNSGGVRGLEPKSRRPRRVRQPQASLEVVERVRAVREQYPRWGREKLRVLLSEEGITISAKSIDRVIGRLKARGVLREAVQPPQGSQVATQEATTTQGVSSGQSRSAGANGQQACGLGEWKGGVPVWGCGLLHPQEGGGLGAAAYQSPWCRVLEAGGDPPFQVQAIQSDGGSEFLKEFGAAIAELQLTHYFNRPQLPSGKRAH